MPAVRIRHERGRSFTLAYVALTEAAIELLTDADQMQTVLAGAPGEWNARNVQIVLECAVVRRESGVPRFLAAYSW